MRMPRRRVRLLLITLSLLALAAAPAAAWGPATHAYVADHTGKAWPYLNRIEMYGALLPDACYFAYGSEYQAACALVAHEQYMRMWEGQYCLRNRALGLGYVSHNEEWGADSTAHDGGYVDLKSYEWALELGSHPVLGALSLGQRVAIAHTVIEAGTDLLVKRIDPFIGSKLTFAALLRGSFVPRQYEAAYAGELALEAGVPDAAAAAILAQIEANFRGAMVLYGVAFMKDETAAIETLAQQFAPLAEYWGVYGTTEEIELLIQYLIVEAVGRCAGDFPAALKATTSTVRMNLWIHGVCY
jgi:hypothetical protein